MKFKELNNVMIRECFIQTIFDEFFFVLRQAHLVRFVSRVKGRSLNSLIALGNILMKSDKIGLGELLCYRIHLQNLAMSSFALEILYEEQSKRKQTKTNRNRSN